MNPPRKNSSVAEVILITDGACRGNPGPGGWAFILRDVKNGKELAESGGEKNTTNNRMELQAVIEGLKRLKRRTAVHVITDSTYVQQGITEWILKWKKYQWRRKTSTGYQPVKNVELWQTFDELVQQHDVTFEWVRGHAGHPDNERCDEMAVEAYRPYLHKT